MERKNITFNAKIVPITPMNDEFTLAKCYVMATGTNRNGSYIGEDAVNNALPTLYNIPVIANLMVDDDDQYHVGGHDMVLTQNKDGALEFRSVCVPFGVVPERPDEIAYEEIEEPGGRGKHTYLTAPVILWTGRFKELKEAFLKEDVYFGQSMEINVNSHEAYSEDPNYTNITDFSFSALCLLGESVEPCFPCASVEPYAFSFDEKFAELMNQLKEELAFCFDNAGKKGEEDMEENNIIDGGQENEIEEPAVAEETPVEDHADEGTAEPEAIAGGEDGAEPANHSENDPDGSFENEGAAEDNDESGDQVEKFASTYMKKREAIAEALPVEVYMDESNERVVRDVSYWLCDFDENFAYVERNDWSRDNGYVETKGRFAYAFDEGSEKATISGEFTEMRVVWLTKEESDKIDAMRNEYTTLVKYKEDREREDREAEYDAAISEFSYMSGNAEYDNVYANRYSYATIEAMKDACYIVKGKYSISAPQRRAGADPIIPVGAPTGSAMNIVDRFNEEYSNK